MSVVYETVSVGDKINLGEVFKWQCADPVVFFVANDYYWPFDL